MSNACRYCRRHLSGLFAGDYCSTNCLLAAREGQSKEEEASKRQEEVNRTNETILEGITWILTKELEEKKEQNIKQNEQDNYQKIQEIYKACVDHNLIRIDLMNPTLKQIYEEVSKTDCETKYPQLYQELQNLYSRVYNVYISPKNTPTEAIFNVIAGIFSILILLLLLQSFGNWVIDIFGLSELKQAQTQTTANNTQSVGWNFPMSACGDKKMSGNQTFYPVFVNRFDQATLSYVRNNYCGDAFIKIRESDGRKVIQVASFTSKSKADEFAQLMLKNNRINSGEVGSPK
jgi:hypothetical protein